VNIQSIVDSNLLGKEEKKVTSWQASKLGLCLSGVVYERLGAKPLEEVDSRTLRVFKCGNLFEEYIVNQLKQYEQYASEPLHVEEQVRVEDPILGVTGYADVVLNFKDYREVIEVKSQHSRAFWYMTKKGQGAYEHHAMQLLIYMYILKIPKGRLVYVSKDDLCIQEYEYTLEDPILKKALSNVKALNEALKSGIMPMPAEEGSFQAKYCRFHKYCTKEIPYEPRT